jgi:hypothetical protein
MFRRYLRIKKKRALKRNATTAISPLAATNGTTRVTAQIMSSPSTEVNNITLTTPAVSVPFVLTDFDVEFPFASTSRSVKDKVGSYASTVAIAVQKGALNDKEKSKITPKTPAPVYIFNGKGVTTASATKSAFVFKAPIALLPAKKKIK